VLNLLLDLNHAQLEIADAVTANVLASWKNVPTGIKDWAAFKAYKKELAGERDGEQGSAKLGACGVNPQDF